MSKSEIIEMLMRCVEKGRNYEGFIGTIDADLLVKALEEEKIKKDQDEEGCDCTECELERYKETL